jgi:hypothetical protein
MRHRKFLPGLEEIYGIFSKSFDPGFSLAPAFRPVMQDGQVISAASAAFKNVESR